jgi:hypothetical protein
MSFLNEAKTESNSANNVNKLNLIQSQLGEKEFKEFNAALKDKTISAAAIQRVLKSRGVIVSENSIRGYRKNV